MTTARISPQFTPKPSTLKATDTPMRAMFLCLVSGKMIRVSSDQTCSLVSRLLARGDSLAIEHGRLRLESASGKQVPAEWLESNHEQLVIEILKQTGIDGLIYESYTTDKYCSKKAGGVTLQFDSLLTKANRYTIFNADRTRARGGKAGSLLPKNQFRLKSGSSFKAFWLSALDEPRRWSALHDYMGKLKGILFDGELTPGKPDRLVATSIRAINLTHQQLLNAFEVPVMPDKCQTSSRQTLDNCQTRKPDKTISPPHVRQGLQPDPATGADSYGNTVKGNAVTRGSVNPLSPLKNPINQTTDDWLADYSATE
jgi:hypothetical protein